MTLFIRSKTRWRSSSPPLILAPLLLLYYKYCSSIFYFIFFTVFLSRLKISYLPLFKHPWYVRAPPVDSKVTDLQPSQVAFQMELQMVPKLQIVLNHCLASVRINSRKDLSWSIKNKHFIMSPTHWNSAVRHRWATNNLVISSLDIWPCSHVPEWEHVGSGWENIQQTRHNGCLRCSTCWTTPNHFTVASIVIGHLFGASRPLLFLI